MQLVQGDVLAAELFGRAVEVFGEPSGTVGCCVDGAPEILRARPGVATGFPVRFQHGVLATITLTNALLLQRAVPVVSKPLEEEDLFDFDDEGILLKLERLFADNDLAEDQSPRDMNDGSDAIW